MFLLKYLDLICDDTVTVNLSQLRVEHVAFLLVLYFLLMPNFVFGLQCKFDTKKSKDEVILNIRCRIFDSRFSFFIVIS